MICLITGEKGGVGKSLVSQGVYYASQEIGPHLVEVETTARLSRIIEGVEHISPPTQSMEELFNNPDCLYATWDKLVDTTTKKENSIVDIGANLFGPFLRWAAASPAQRKILQSRGLTAVSVMTMDRDALQEGFSALQEVADDFPDARRVACFNPLIGDFAEQDKVIDRMLKVATGSGSQISRVYLRRMNGPGWGHLMNWGALPDLLTEEKAAKLAEIIGSGPADRTMAVYQTWYGHFLKALKPIMVADA